MIIDKHTLLVILFIVWLVISAVMLTLALALDNLFTIRRNNSHVIDTQCLNHIQILLDETQWNNQICWNDNKDMMNNPQLNLKQEYDV